jgi:preprotein translocase subunit YajC
MNSFALSLLMAVPPSDGTAAAPSLFSTLLPIVFIIAIFYFLMIRPESKRRKEVQKMQSSLEKGDKIVTSSGIHGVIHSVKDQTVIVKVDENVRLEFSRSVIASVENPGKEEKAGKAEIEDGKSGKAGKDGKPGKAEKEEGKNDIKKDAEGTSPE